MSSIILIGGFVEIIELCDDSGIEIFGIIDKSAEKILYGHPVIGGDNDIPSMYNKIRDFTLVITPDNPALRERLYKLYKNYGFIFTGIISKNSTISKSAHIGEGTIIQSGVNISSEAHIGKFVKVNSCANIMHNSVIGDFTTIAPNAVVLGYVMIGSNCYIGANATILPNIHICDNSIIGAGAVVTKNIEKPFHVYAGVPAKQLKK